MNLKVGSKSDDVKELQALLNIVPATGYFGNQTFNAVKVFQKANGLKEDGEVGDITWNILNRKNKLTPVINITNTLVGNITIKDIINIQSELPNEVVSVIKDINSLISYQITNKFRLAHLLGQCAHESMMFKKTSENLNYSAEGLLKNFPHYFPNIDIARQYAHKQEMIANKLYANRMGNGNEASGDGYKNRGHGYIQLTGAYMVDLFSKWIGIDCRENPEIIANKYPFESAIFFFEHEKIWTKCDKGISKSVVTAVTREINPGLLDLEKRYILINHFYDAMNK